jgi:TatD DNase family protein
VIRWFDSHCHLHLCEEDASLEDVVACARSAGVTAMLTVGIDAASSVRSLEIARRYELWSSAGVHPNSAREFEDSADGIEQLLADERVVAVGETGLDFYRDSCPPVVQRTAFAAHIALAKKHDKALVVHTRDSVDDALDVLESEGPPPRLVFHCWSGGADQLRRALDLGAFASFAGNISFRNAEELRSVARTATAERLLVETDSPFLSPMPHRGKPNEPQRVVDVGNALAKTMGVAPTEVARQTFANARALFEV